MAALNEIDGAVERFEAARAAVAAALTNAVQVFPSVEALAEVTAFDPKEIRAYERRHRREQQGERVPQQASGEAEPVTVPTG